MNRWFFGLMLAGAMIAGATSLAATAAQPVPTTSPMASASPTPMTTMRP
ncbi:MAG: hypothetical protein JO030_06290 [Candidatus Eremiobacteraeota bacterium]|nr:hypothetical protein [Candidatus Eremiobacteraeota bacterium]